MGQKSTKAFGLYCDFGETESHYNLDCQYKLKYITIGFCFVFYTKKRNTIYKLHFCLHFWWHRDAYFEQIQMSCMTLQLCKIRKDPQSVENWKEANRNG